MEEDDKGCPMIMMGVSGWMFLLVPAYPGSPGQKAVKRLCVSVCVSYSVSLITIEDHKKSYVGLSDKPLLNPCDGPQGVSTYKAPYFATP